MSLGIAVLRLRTDLLKARVRPLKTKARPV